MTLEICTNQSWALITIIAFATGLALGMMLKPVAKTDLKP